MIILLKLLLILIAAIGISSICIYISIKVKQNNVYNSYKLMDILLQKRYSLISAILSKIQTEMQNDATEITYAAKLRDEAMTLGIKKENLNRRFAFDHELSLTMQSILEKIKNYTNLNSNVELNNTINTYLELNNKIKSNALIYNKNAELLKHAIDVFPSSFISRLNNVKRVDYFKI